MPTTPLMGLPFPGAGAAPNVPLDIQTLAQRVETVIGEPWVPYVPNLGSGWFLGNGLLEARYRAVGKTVDYWARLRFGSTTTLTTQNSSIGLPIVRRDPQTDAYVGRGVATDASTSEIHLLDHVLNGATAAAANIWVSRTGTRMTAGSPIAWAVNDTVMVTGTYERS